MRTRRGRLTPRGEVGVAVTCAWCDSGCDPICVAGRRGGGRRRRGAGGAGRRAAARRAIFFVRILSHTGCVLRTTSPLTPLHTSHHHTRHIKITDHAHTRHTPHREPERARPCSVHIRPCYHHRARSANTYTRMGPQRRRGGRRPRIHAKSQPIRPGHTRHGARLYPPRLRLSRPAIRTLNLNGSAPHASPFSPQTRPTRTDRIRAAHYLPLHVLGL